MILQNSFISLIFQASNFLCFVVVALYLNTSIFSWIISVLCYLLSCVHIFFFFCGFHVFLSLTEIFALYVNSFRSIYSLTIKSRRSFQISFTHLTLSSGRTWSSSPFRINKTLFIWNNYRIAQWNFSAKYNMIQCEDILWSVITNAMLQRHEEKRERK